MAVVFISPQAKQRKFLKVAGGTMAMVLLVLILVFLIKVLLGTSNVALEPSANQDVAINFNVIDSAKFLSLEPFYSAQTSFTYVVVDKSGRQIQGNISAASKEDAQTSLEASGYKVSSLEEMTVGRSEPFIAY